MSARSRPLLPYGVVLGVLVLCFLGLAWLYVPRLVNCIWTDREFTGWIGPIASRLSRGERLYQDFTLPIPPGSFILLAGVQRLLGRSLILDDLWVITLCQLGMLLVSYPLVRRFTSPRNAVLAVAATAPVLIATPKEIAYDQTAQLCSWISLALLARALTAARDQSRCRWLLLTGLTAGATLAFKSSTGAGAVGGSLAALALVTAVGWRREGLAGVRALLRPWLSLGLGLGAGAALTVAAVLSVGGRLSEFYQVVFVDGPALKGGRWRVVGNFASYTILQAPVELTVLTGALFVYVLLRVARRRHALVLPLTPPGTLPPDRGRHPAAFAAGASLLTGLAYGTAMLLLSRDVAAVPAALRIGGEYSPTPLMLGFLVLGLYLLTNLRGAHSATDRRTAYAAVIAAAGLQALAHNLSSPHLRLIIDNNAILPLGLAALLHLLDQARSPLLKAAAFSVCLLGLFGGKLQRWLDARYPVDDPGFWRGTKVSEQGRTLVAVARRARDLAGPEGTVLMLPEDLMFEAFIDRRRPQLFSTAIYVDQFPARALAGDLAALHAHPPDVLILLPRDPHDWKEVYQAWQHGSPAERLQVDFVGKRLAPDYRLDSSYPTKFFDRYSMLDIYVRTNRQR